MGIDDYTRLITNRHMVMKRNMLHNGISVILLGILLVAGSNIFAGCREFEEKTGAEAGEIVEVAVGFSDEALTKSSIGDVNSVNTVQIAAYRTSDGMLYDSSNDPSSLSLRLLAGYDYRIFSLVNCGASAVVWPQKLSQVESLSFTAGSALFTGGAPMAGDVTVTVNGDMSLTLTPKRLLSKWTVKFVDQDALGYQVKFVRMRHSASNATPWRYSEGFSSADGMTGTGASVATAVFDTGDYGSSSDVTAVTSASGAVFYVMENARGTVSGLGGSAQMSDLQASSEAATTYGLYTFLEIGLDFPAGADYERDPLKASAEADVIYRVFLRKDAVNNLSVVRNTLMSLTLTGTRAGIDDPSIDWRIEDNTVPSGNKITGTVYPVDWNTDNAGASQTADHFTPTIYNLIVKAAGVASWRDYFTMQSILDDSAVMAAVCGSDESVYLIVSELEPTTDIKAFEAKVDELELGATIDGALSGSAYFDKLDYSSADVSSTPTAYNTRRNYPADAGHCWFEDEDRVIVIFKGAMWYNNYESVTFPPPSQTYGDSQWYLRRIIAHPVLNPDLVFVDQIGSYSSSLVSGTTVKTSPFRASFCGIYLSNDTNAVINSRDESYPTYELLTSYLLKTGYKVPSGVIYAKADWTGRSNAGYNLVPNTADMTSSSFKKPKKTSGSFTGYDAMRTVAFGSLDGYSTDVPSPGHVGKPLENSYVFHPSYSEWGDYVPQFVLAENITPHDKHLIVSCYIKSKTETGYSNANVKLCLRDAENTLKGESLVETVNGAAYFEAEHMISMNSSTEYYGNSSAFSSNGTWTRVTVAFTLTDEGAERPLQIGLYADRVKDTYTDGGVDYNYECDLYVAAFMVEPGAVDHGYVPFWNEGRGFSVDVSNVYSDRTEAGRARCTWYAKTWDSPVDLDGDPNVLPYRHNWQWEEWKPLGRSLAE